MTHYLRQKPTICCKGGGCTGDDADDDDEDDYFMTHYFRPKKELFVCYLFHCCYTAFLLEFQAEEYEVVYASVFSS